MLHHAGNSDKQNVFVRVHQGDEYLPNIERNRYSESRRNPVVLWNITQPAQVQSHVNFEYI